MKISRFSEAQIMGILKHADGGVPVAELCRERRLPFFANRLKVEMPVRFEGVSDEEVEV